MTAHTPVLVEPLLRLTTPADGRLERVIDGTLGAGGHTGALLEAGAAAVLALDLDECAIATARRVLAPYLDRVSFAHSSYVNMRALANQRGWHEVDAIIMDLGLSSMQLDDPARGFAFRHQGPLDMRFDVKKKSATAEELVNTLPETELADLFFRYGEEKGRPPDSWRNRGAEAATQHGRAGEPGRKRAWQTAANGEDSPGNQSVSSAAHRG